MKRICAWCKIEMGTSFSNTVSDDIITHGICQECMSRIFEPLTQRAKLMDFLNKLNAPVVLVDNLGTVSTANEQALALIQKELQNVEGYSGGDVFECAYAKLPEGCGKTIHCDGCTIRNTVMDSLHTGKSHLNAPAYLKRGTPEDINEIKFLISTERVKDMVLLRIDKVGSH